MKNKILISLMFVGIFLFSMISVSAWSYDNSEVYGQARAYAQVEGTYPICEGVKYGNYCVGDYYVNVDFQGDNYYLGYGYTNWPSANSNGYSGISSTTPGRKTLPIDSSGHPESYILCAWDFDRASNGDWAWTGKCGGYLQSSFPELNVVECYQASDCSGNQYCNKNGQPNDWSCQPNVCNEGDTQCDGKTSTACVLDETNKYDGRTAWENEGINIGSCGVECIETSDCSIDQECSNNQCEDLPDITIYRLENNQCSQLSIRPSEETSSDYSTLEQCNENKDLNILPIILISSLVLIIAIVAFILLRRKK